MKLIAKILLGLLVVFAITGIFLLWSFGSGIPTAVKKEIEVSQYSGVITGIDTVQSCFIKISVRAAGCTTNLDVQNCCGSGFDTFFKFIEVGDSITRQKGQLTLMVSKQQHQQRKEFSYPYCFK